MKYSIDIPHLIRSRSKPLLIWICPPFMIVHAAFTLLFLVVFAGSPGGFSLDGLQFSGVALWFVYPALWIAALIQLFTAYGLLTERLWARPLATKGAAVLSVVFVLIYIQGGVSPAVALRANVYGVVWLALAFWYFYRYKAVVEYYEQLEWRNLAMETT